MLHVLGMLRILELLYLDFVSLIRKIVSKDCLNDQIILYQFFYKRKRKVLFITIGYFLPYTVTKEIVSPLEV